MPKAFLGCPLFSINFSVAGMSVLFAEEVADRRKERDEEQRKESVLEDYSDTGQTHWMVRRSRRS